MNSYVSTVQKSILCTECEWIKQSEVIFKSVEYSVHDKKVCFSLVTVNYGQQQIYIKRKEITESLLEKITAINAIFLHHSIDIWARYFLVDFVS